MSSPDCSCFSSYFFSCAKIKVLLLPVPWRLWAWWWPKSGRPSLVSCNTGTIVIIGINIEFLVEQDHIYKISICLIFSPVFEARVPRQQQALSHKIGSERWHISGPQLLQELERIFEREPVKPKFTSFKSTSPPHCKSSSGGVFHTFQCSQSYTQYPGTRRRRVP